MFFPRWPQAPTCAPACCATLRKTRAIRKRPCWPTSPTGTPPATSGSGVRSTKDFRSKRDFRSIGGRLAPRPECTAQRKAGGTYQRHQASRQCQGIRTESQPAAVVVAIYAQREDESATPATGTGFLRIAAFGAAAKPEGDQRNGNDLSPVQPDRLSIGPGNAHIPEAFSEGLHRICHAPTLGEPRKKGSGAAGVSRERRPILRTRNRPPWPCPPEIR